jgi:glycosyltransferase involved in cell wall biosynthesis
MKILYHFRTRGTGAEGVHIAGIASAFEKLGHRVVFSSPGGNDPRITAGGSPFGRRAGLLAWLPGVIFELLEIAYNFAALARHRRLLRHAPFDLIYERHAFFLCSTAWLAARRDVPLVVEVNELAGDERVRATPSLLPLARLADRFTFARARLIVVVSPHLQRRIVALGIAPEKILVLPNAVAEETLATPPDGIAQRTRHGWEQTLVIGFVGWFVAWHRLDGLLAQFAALCARYSALRLLLVGEGPLQSELSTQAARLGVRERVLFTGAVPHACVPDTIAAMDVAVVPHSNAYRSPIKLFEFMAQGRAIVAPRTEPIALVLRHEENGLLFAPGDFDDLGRQIARLLADPVLRARLGRQAQTDLRTKHTWAQNVRAVLAALDSAAGM